MKLEFLKAHLKRWAFFVLAVVSVTACGDSAFLYGGREMADRVAARGGWERFQTTAGPFNLLGYRSIRAPSNGDLSVYIEGDGFAWVTKTQLSSDPTPRIPIALELASEDPSANRLYLARPCQYQSDADLARCSPKYWSGGRYSEEVVAAMNAAIDQTVRATGAKRLRLFGFSGGGAIAALIAARRTDVIQLVTVAGNLDHAAWTTIRKVSPLSASLNPADMASTLSRIPQIHFVGKDDSDVPPKVAQSYRSRFSDPARISIIEVPGVDHDCCWVERWSGLLKQYVYVGAS
ncbi:MAG: alpha/beta hydrolase [Alphaproteobacteria bacterium]|nr:alpha/beta hydrolase [Alphaproteobacteria bacterium]